jgi:hypothetical protein
MGVIIDDLEYISFPLSCSREQIAEDKDPGGDVLSMFNVVIACIRESALHSTYTRPLASAMSLAGEDPVAALLGLSTTRRPIALPVLHRF